MPVNTATYERQRRNVNQDFGARSASNAYSRTLSQRRGSRSLSDLSRSFGRSLPRFQAGFGQRGLSGPGVDSGVHRAALGRYVGDYRRSLGRMQTDVADQDRQFQLNQANLGAQRERALADIEAQKQNEIALAALNIRALAPFFTGGG